MPDMGNEVRAQVARRLHAAPVLFPLTEEETDTDDEDHAVRTKRKGFKSGKIRTTDLYVTKRVIWPHEMCTNAQGQPPVYLDMSLALFTNGFLCVAAAESGPIREYMLEHLQELMEDIESHGWKVVRDYKPPGFNCWSRAERRGVTGLRKKNSGAC